MIPAALLIATAHLALAQPTVPLDFLRGPSVRAETALTLVRRAADGSFQRVQGRPEIAAALLLSADEPTRERIRALEHDRAERLRRALLANFDTLLATIDARTARRGEDAQTLLTSLQRTFGVREGVAGARDPLTPAIRQLLPNHLHDDHQRLVDDYWRAWVDETITPAPAPNPAPTRAERSRVEQRLAHTLFREEALRLYRRTMRHHDAWTRQQAEAQRLATPDLARLRRTLGEAVLRAEAEDTTLDHAAILERFNAPH